MNIVTSGYVVPMLLYTRVVVVGGQGEDPEGEDAQGEPPVLGVVPQGQLQPSTQPWSSLTPVQPANLSARRWVSSCVTFSWMLSHTWP